MQSRVFSGGHVTRLTWMFPSVAKTSATGTDWTNCIKPGRRVSILLVKQFLSFQSWVATWQRAELLLPCLLLVARTL